ncbi:hypothetical protein KJ765_05800 [Candidatus Micrarchaeota archaeon]|nr:hypothetical protein [Candidatus Micrarchaeota archaeon]
MVLSLDDGVPLISGGKDARSQVIRVLSKTYPLNAKQIFRAIQKSQSSDLTYQAVHKSIRSLVEKKIVSKNEGGAYLLDLEWARQIKRFGEDVEAKYAGNNLPHFSDIQEGESITVSFDTYLQYCYWGLQETYLTSLSKKNLTTLGWLRHIWPIVNISQEQFQILKNVMSTGRHYIICNKTTPLDLLLADFFSKFGKKTKFGLKYDVFPDYFIVDDYVLEVYIPKKMILEFDRIYSNTKSLEGKDLAELYDLISQKNSGLTAILMKNRNISKNIFDKAITFGLVDKFDKM